MKKLIILAAALTAISCTAASGWKNGSMNRMRVQENDILKKFVIKQPERFSQEYTLPAFRLMETELLTLKSDINNDGKADIIGSVDNFKFYENGYPVFILLKTEYWHTQIRSDVRTENFNISVLDTVSNGFRDISVDGRILKFNGENYQ